MGRDRGGDRERNVHFPSLSSLLPAFFLVVAGGGGSPPTPASIVLTYSSASVIVTSDGRRHSQPAAGVKTRPVQVLALKGERVSWARGGF